METLVELLKSSGANPLVLAMVVGWVAREVVALRRSNTAQTKELNARFKAQGERIGDLEARLIQCEATLNVNKKVE